MSAWTDSASEAISISGSLSELEEGSTATMTGEGTLTGVGGGVGVGVRVGSSPGQYQCGS
jgi:hypothetical protein